MLFDDLTAALAKIQWRMRRRFRDIASTAPDPYRYTALMRELLDRHLRADPAVLRVPPEEITDPTFLAAVDAKRNDEARARECQHALRAYLDQQYGTDPARLRRLSYRLDELVRSHDHAWDQLADELRDLVDVALQGTEVVVSGPEGLLYRILREHIPADHDLVIDLAHDLYVQIALDRRAPHFADNEFLQDDLRKSLLRLIRIGAGLGRAEAGPIAEEIMEEIRASEERFRLVRPPERQQRSDGSPATGCSRGHRASRT